MQYTKPLVELIAELQAIADANPGIVCTLDDHEWGPHIPTVKVSPVYVNEHEHVIVLEDFTRDYTTKTAKEYSEKTAKEMWDSYGENKGSWKSFEEFEKGHALVKEHALKDLKDFATAVPMVVFQA